MKTIKLSKLVGSLAILTVGHLAVSQPFKILNFKPEIKKQYMSGNTNYVVYQPKQSICEQLFNLEFINLDGIYALPRKDWSFILKQGNSLITSYTPHTDNCVRTSSTRSKDNYIIKIENGSLTLESPTTKHTKTLSSILKRHMILNLDQYVNPNIYRPKLVEMLCCMDIQIGDNNFPTEVMDLIITQMMTIEGIKPIINLVNQLDNLGDISAFAIDDWDKNKPVHLTVINGQNGQDDLNVTCIKFDREFWNLILNDLNKN
jgi:hypothetical protein